MSAEQQTDQAEGTDPANGRETAEEPKLRRRPLGYSKRDVREALDRQRSELSAREAELAELRQDIAALWLAFAQHDRMIRRALGPEYERVKDGAARAAAPDGAGPAVATAAADQVSAEAPVPSEAAAVAGGDDDPGIGRQLSDLDDVLAAIELATQTLERTYTSGTGRPAAEPSAPEADEGGAERAAG